MFTDLPSTVVTILDIFKKEHILISLAVGINSQNTHCRIFPGHIFKMAESSLQTSTDVCLTIESDLK